MSDRREELLRDSFAHLDTRAVALPHWVWKVDLQLEMDRQLRLLEETVLGLVAAGIGDPALIGRLVGDPELVTPALVDLIAHGAIGQIDGRLQVKGIGSDMLRSATSRESRSYEDCHLLHDPYTDELRWEFDEPPIGAHQLGASGLKALPTLPGLEATALACRHEEVEQLIERDGLPFDTAEAKSRRREVVRLVAKHAYVAYRQVDLEIWHRADRDEWRWRLLRGGGEDRAASARLEQLELSGNDIIPFDEAPREPDRAETRALSDAISTTVRTGTGVRILQVHEHRPALRDALLEDARRELIIVSPWLATNAVDADLLSWIEQALRRNKELRIRIGYGIEPTGKTKRADRDQQEALKRLRQVSERNRGRIELVEIGNTHEKVVICDDRYAIVTSFNFLSFKPRPGRGIRLETGTLVEDPSAVHVLRQNVLRTFQSSR